MTRNGRRWFGVARFTHRSETMITKTVTVYGQTLEVTLPEDVWEQISEQQIAAQHGISPPVKAKPAAKAKK